jgi:uncharacterized protein YjbI with pentapeptide repeats
MTMLDVNDKDDSDFKSIVDSTANKKPTQSPNGPFLSMPTAVVAAALFSLIVVLPQAGMAVSGGGLDYAGTDISGQNFSNSNYKGKDFTQVIAKGTNFAKSNLQGCRFYKAYLVRKKMSILQTRMRTWHTKSIGADGELLLLSLKTGQCGL